MLDASSILTLTNDLSELWRSGALDAAKTVGSKKRARPSELVNTDSGNNNDDDATSAATSTTAQLRRRFETFFESLLSLLGKKEASGGSMDLLDLKIKALDAIVHFMAHASSL